MNLYDYALSFINFGNDETRFPTLRNDTGYSTSLDYKFKDETYQFLYLNFNVDEAKRILQSTPHKIYNVPIEKFESWLDSDEVNPDGSHSINLLSGLQSEEHLKRADYNFPIIFAPTKRFGGFLIDGHGRLNKAAKEGQKTVKVVILEESEVMDVLRSGNTDEHFVESAFNENDDSSSKFDNLKTEQHHYYKDGRDYVGDNPKQPTQEVKDIFHKFHAAISDIIEFSETTHNEAGFVICTKDGKLYKQPNVYGSENETLSGLAKCKDADNEGIAIIHTHPDEVVSQLSPDDLIAFAFSDLKYIIAIDTEPNPRKKNHYHITIGTKDSGVYEFYDSF